MGGRGGESKVGGGEREGERESIRGHSGRCKERARGRGREKEGARARVRKRERRERKTGK